MTDKTIDRDAYRTAYNFHLEAAHMLDKFGIDDFWTWFWNRAGQIDSEQNKDFLQGMLIEIALELERKSIALMGG